TLENIPLSGARAGGGERVPQVRDVARLVPTEAPVEVYRFDSGRVSQLFVSVADNDLAGVAAKVDRIVAELPLEYARSLAPADKLMNYADKLLAAEHPDLHKDEDFKGELAAYFARPTPEGREAITDSIYDIDPESLSLFQNEDFR